MTTTATAFDTKDQIALIKLLKTRFEKNNKRHAKVEWAQVQARLDADPDKLKVLFAMETTGGEPDVVGVDEQSGEIIFLIA